MVCILKWHAGTRNVFFSGRALETVDSSIHLNVAEFQAIHTIVGECCELWADPSAWQTHLLNRAARLADCRMGIYYELADQPGKVCSKILSATDTGWSRESERRTLIEALANKDLTYSPLWATFADGLSHRDGRTLRQRAVIHDKRWHSSEMYDHHVRPTELGEGILSAVWMPHSSQWSMWCVCNDRSDRTLTLRQEERIAVLHRFMAPLIGTRLCTRRNRSIENLSTRRRQVLSGLLDGYSEKQIAAALFRSEAAVHDHVKYLYRHFGSNSRGELAAYFVHRQPVNDPAKPVFDLRTHWLERRRQLA